MLLDLSPIKSLFQIAQRHKTSRIFTTSIFNVVKKLLVSVALVFSIHDKTHPRASEFPNIHLADGKSEQAADTFEPYH